MSREFIAPGGIRYSLALGGMAREAMLECQGFL